MATETPTTLNAQDFSGSDDEILDNFAEGPTDDGIPLGVGGEMGKQSEPASSTMEADIVNGTNGKDTDELNPDEQGILKQPSDENPLEDSADENEPVPVVSETVTDDSVDEPDTPDFSPALLQMAGYKDAAEAKFAGFGDPESLFAAVKWRSQLLTPSDKPTQTFEEGLYRPKQTPTQIPTKIPQVTEQVEGESDYILPEDKMDMLDEDLQDVLRNMNEHHKIQDASRQQELQSLRTELKQREDSLATQQEQGEEKQFDDAVQELGKGWEDVFGNGSGMELASAGNADPVAMTNFNHRALLFEAVQAVREVNAKQGYNPMDLKQEVQWALMQRYPDKFKQSISGNSNGSQNKGSRPGVTASRPTQRNAPPKGRNNKALADVNAMLNKRKGYSLDMGQDDEYDGEI